MIRDHVVTLISTGYQADALAQQIPTESKREVYCRIDSISQTEWFQAGHAGLKPQCKLTVFAGDYQGETLVELDNQRYGVYRTYLAKHDRMELYLERKGGV